MMKYISLYFILETLNKNSKLLIVLRLGLIENEGEILPISI